MIDHWNGVELENTDFDYQHDRTPSVEIIPSQISELKHVENIKVSDKPTFDTSLGRSWIGVSRV